MLAEHVDHILEDENFEQTIVGFDTNFSRYLLELLDKIMDENTKTYEHKLFNIIYRFASIIFKSYLFMHVFGFEFLNRWVMTLVKNE